jgi:pimeloyl-ACP methyl ester carboxylesterase
MTDVKFETMPDGIDIAWRQDGGEDLGRCGFFWLCGFRSDMEGAKAETLAVLARETRRLSLRFDYSGHGQSGGLFVDGSISLWLSQALHMFTKHASGRRIVIGSSMGGWLAMLLYRQLKMKDPAAARRIAGLVLIAPATDMTADLMWDEFDDAAREALATAGVYLRPSQYGEPYPITARLITDGEKHLMLKQGLACDCPVRILQGDQDPDVPPSHAMKVFEAIHGGDVAMTLVKGGDHRLSSPGQLKLIRETVMALANRSDGLSV